MYETRNETPPETKLETRVETKLFRFGVPAQFVVLGFWETKLETKLGTFAAPNVAFAAPNVAMTSVSLLRLLTMPCKTSLYLRSLSSLSGYERCVERSAAAKHDASGNAMALSGSAPILWYLRAVARHNLVNPYDGLCGCAGRPWPSESACTIEAPALACSISWNQSRTDTSLRHHGNPKPAL